MITLAHISDESLIPYLWSSFYHTTVLADDYTKLTANNNILLKHDGTVRIMDIVKKVSKAQQNITVLCDTSITAGYTDLDDKEKLIEYIQKQFGFKTCNKTKKLLTNYKSYNSYQFSRFIKQSLLRNKWEVSILQEENNTYDMLQAFSSGKEDFAKAVLQCSEQGGSRKMLGTLLSFLAKAENYDNVKKDASKGYRKTLRKAAENRQKTVDKIRELSYNKSVAELELKVLQSFL